MSALSISELRSPFAAMVRRINKSKSKSGNSEVAAVREDRADIRAKLEEQAAMAKQVDESKFKSDADVTTPNKRSRRKPRCTAQGPCRRTGCPRCAQKALDLQVGKPALESSRSPRAMNREARLEQQALDAKSISLSRAVDSANQAYQQAKQKFSRLQRDRAAAEIACNTATNDKDLKSAKSKLAIISKWLALADDALKAAYEARQNADNARKTHSEEKATKLTEHSAATAK